jgi:hypothetical protein
MPRRLLRHGRGRDGTASHAVLLAGISMLSLRHLTRYLMAERVLIAVRLSRNWRVDIGAADNGIESRRGPERR